MAVTISGQNNNDKILASDGVLDSISGFNVVGVMTASTFDVTGKTTTNHISIGNNIHLGNAGIITATTLLGNVTGNINHESNLLLQISGSEKFRVGNGGQFGIAGANYGTAGQVFTSGGSGSAPTWSTIASDLIQEGNTQAEVVDTGSDGHFKVITEGTERLRINSSGLVSIPGDIDVDGHTNLDNVSIAGITTITNGFVDLKPSNGGNAHFRILSTGTGDAGIFFDAANGDISGSDYVFIGQKNNLDFVIDANANAGNIDFQRAGTTQVRIKSNGYVGIGTDNPQRPLSVTNGTSGVTAEFNIPDNSPTGSAGLSLNIVNRSNSGYAPFSFNASVFAFGINAVEKVRITSGGQVCIGTNTAVRALTIKDPGQIHVESTSTGNWVGMSIKGSSGTNNYNAYFGLLDSNGDFFIDNGSNGNDFVINQAGQVTVNGNFGVGTASPTDKLDVNGTAIIRSNLYLNNNTYLASNKGIYFDGGTGSANHLDDYEYGSWTPYVRDAVSGGNSASGTKQGRYVKVGRQVTIMLSCRSLSNGGMNGSNQMFVTNLPFRMNGVEQIGIYCQLRYFNNIDNTQFGTHFQLNQNDTVLRLSKQDDNTGDVVPITFNHWMYSSGYFAMHATFTYETDQ